MFKNIVDLVTGLAWPLIILGLAAWMLIQYRKEIRQFLAHTTNVGLGPLTITADARERVEQAVESDLAESNEELQQAALAAGEDIEDVDERRERIEAVIQVAAEWGWQRAAVSQEPPKPTVTWEDDTPAVQDPVQESDVRVAVDSALHQQAAALAHDLRMALRPQIDTRVINPKIDMHRFLNLKTPIITIDPKTGSVDVISRRGGDDEPPSVPAKI